jgi:hypothetical protein
MFNNINNIKENSFKNRNYLKLILLIVNKVFKLLLQEWIKYL